MVAFHETVGPVVYNNAASAGEASVGAAGVVTIVAKDRTAEYPLVPVAFVAFTLQ